MTEKRYTEEGLSLPERGSAYVGQDRSPPPLVALPERLVTALLVAGLQSPSGQQLWMGYVLGRSDVPWLETERFRLTRCQATVEHTPPQGTQSVVPNEQRGGVDGVALSTAGG